MSFFNEIGPVALGSRVRFLADRITQDAAAIYEAYGTNLQPKWFPVFYVLSTGGENSVTSIAAKIGHSHVSVSKILREMSAAGLIAEKADRADRRRTHVSLSRKGSLIAEKIKAQYADVTAAIEELAVRATHNLWAALGEWEYLLNQKSLRDRVAEQRKRRESQHVKIVEYKPKHREAFYKLNEEWISKYFKMEQPDRDALGNPEGYILKKGGAIFVAMLDGEAVGVCALLKRKDDRYPYELAKMAVAPAAQGKNIGYLLGRAVIRRAAELGAERLFLESNTVLAPAIRLYEKLGFRKIAGPPTPYERCNIQMALELSQARSESS